MKTTRLWLVYLGLLMTTLGCNGGGSADTDVPIIRTGSEFSQYLIEVESLSKYNFEKVDNGVPLEPYEEDQLRRAKVIFNGLIGYQPESAGLYLGLGKTQQYFGEHEEAIKTFSTGADFITNMDDSAAVRTLAEFYYLASLSYEAIQRYDAVDQFIEKAIAIDEKNPNFLAVRASSSLQQGDVKGAKADLTQALKLDPKHRRALQLIRLIESEESSGAKKPNSNSSSPVPSGNGG